MQKLTDLIPDDWHQILKDEFDKDYWPKLEYTVAEEMEKHEVFPPGDEIFNAFKLTPYQKVKVLLLGQDPYHDIGQAHGLCFSVCPGVKLPPSLKNIYKELADDLGFSLRSDGCLIPWTEQGVLMLNTSLTVRAHQAASHSKIGWTTFTDSVIKAVSQKKEPVVFVLWGAHAIAKENLIDTAKHTIIKSVHPSPLSAHRGFLGSRPFSKINKALESYGCEPVNW